MKFKIEKGVCDNVYYLSVMKWFYWAHVCCFSAYGIDEAITKGKELAHNYKYPTAEFEL